MPYAADDADARRELARELQTAWADPAAPAARGDVRAIGMIEAFIDGEWRAASEAFDGYSPRSPWWLAPLATWWMVLAQRRGEASTALAAIRRALPDGPATEPGDRQYIVLDELYRLTIDLALDAQDAVGAYCGLPRTIVCSVSSAVYGRAHNQLAVGALPAPGRRRLCRAAVRGTGAGVRK